MGATFKGNSTVGTEQDVDVERIIIHENYSRPLNNSNDIALLRLARPVNRTEAAGAPCLSASRNSLVNKTCWITGWGNRSFDGNHSIVLMQAAVPLVSHQRCQVAHQGRVDDSMMCAGPDQAGLYTCQEDSGGSLVCEFDGKWYLEGVSSFSDACEAPGNFGVYAKVRVFTLWVINMMMMNSTYASIQAAYATVSSTSAASALYTIALGR